MPTAVATELTAPATPRPVRAWMALLPDWCEILPDPLADPTLDFLDPGERAAISLALSLAADRVLIDESQGRGEAARLRLQVTGTMGVLIEAHRRNLLDFEVALGRLESTNFYLSTQLVFRARQLAFS